MLCLWSFLLGSWATTLVFEMQRGDGPPLSVMLGIFVALGGLVLWVSFARSRGAE